MQGSPAQWMPQLSTTVMLISSSIVLQNEVARVSAAAAVDLVAAQSVEQAAGQWDGIAAVLLGGDVDSPLPGWKGPTVLVGAESDSSLLWARAATAGVDRVAILPESGPWLAGYLARLRDPSEGGTVVGIVGACGGAGASTVALLLAARAAAKGADVLVIDANPIGGGLETLLAAEEKPGLRWPDLLNASGAINPEQLRASLPESNGISLLSWPSQLHLRGEPTKAPLSVVHEVLRASRQAFSLVVVDLGRETNVLLEVGSECDQFLMPVHGRLGCVASGRSTVASLPAAPISLLLRLPLSSGVDVDTVAQAAGLPCAGTLARLSRIDEQFENGRVADVARSRKIGKVLDALLKGLADDAGNKGIAETHGRVGEGKQGAGMPAIGAGSGRDEELSRRARLRSVS